jgi:hypothetical protein
MKSIVFLFETRKKNRNEPKFEFPAAQYILSKRNQSRAEEIPGAPPTDNLFGPFIHCASCESVSSSIDPSIPARAPKNGANPSPISRSALLPLAIFPSLDLAPQTLTPPLRAVHGVAAQAAPPTAAQIAGQLQLRPVRPAQEGTRLRRPGPRRGRGGPVPVALLIVWGRRQRDRRRGPQAPPRPILRRGGDAVLTGEEA